MTENILGTHELIDFPDFGIKSVKAKIDTGADSSSIWASDIKENGGVLSFVLFDKKSRFYSGTEITTKNYTVSSIKNSFGTSEFRYKVLIRTVIKGRVIRATFTLADRSNNRYPILIGRRTLKGKFLVDVSRDKVKKNYEILVLCSDVSAEKQDFFRSIDKENKELNFLVVPYSELQFFINPSGCEIKTVETNRDIASFDMVYYSSSLKCRDIAAATAQYLKKREVMFFDQAVHEYAESSKLIQYVILSDNNIPLPRSIYFDIAVLRKSYPTIVKKLGLPFVVKDIHGRKGRNNYLVSDEKSFSEACKVSKKENIKLIAQKFIPNDGDFRVLIFGRQIRLIIHRVNKRKGSYLNNVSMGADATIVNQKDLPGAIQKMAIQAAMLLYRQVAGVDLVEDKNTGSWYCLEVNDSPQIATGSHVKEKNAAFTKFITKELNR
ncbi:MAG TPA: RimK/LysX family protein [Candidatus Saccharimonadia bacterium]|nr:RimK/LysX family protein [Candidatus Saccharimonadia bacterium]